MPRKKHLKLAEAKTLPNLIHDPLKGSHNYFQNNNPITLELGCGKGEYSLALAQQYPGRNFIGIDKKADRLWYAAKKASELDLPNVLFLRAQVDLISDYFAPQSINEIWITFPDPFSKRTDANKRLISPRFLAYYKMLLQPQGLVHLKTDNADLFSYAKQILAAIPVVIEEMNNDIYSQTTLSDYLAIQTTFEKRYLQQGKSIKYIRFHF